VSPGVPATAAGKARLIAVCPCRFFAGVKFFTHPVRPRYEPLYGVLSPGV